MIKIILFFIMFLTSCQSEYIDFHKNKNVNVENNLKNEEFSFEKINYLSWITLESTPNLNLLDELSKKIENSKSRVYVEVYIFTEKRLKKSLIKAKKSWIDVKVILEKNIYMAWNLNSQVKKDLENSWIEVVYSNPKNYSLNHTKMMIIDDEVILSTWNYSYSTFKYNKEFFVFIKDKNILNKLLQIYDLDFKWLKKDIYDANIVLSPNFSRMKLEYLLNNSKKSIKMYVHNISDKNILDILKIKQNEKNDIKILMPDLKKVSSNKDEIEFLKQNKINIKLLDKPEVHAKTILVDDKYLYIWSVNFSTSSMDQNREIWILIKNEDIIKKFNDIFKNDFK